LPATEPTVGTGGCVGNGAGVGVVDVGVGAGFEVVG